MTTTAEELDAAIANFYAITATSPPPAPTDFPNHPDAYLAGWLQGASRISPTALVGDIDTYRSLFAEAARRLTR